MPHKNMNMIFQNFASYIWKSHQFAVQKFIFVYKVINKRFSDDNNRIYFGLCCENILLLGVL